MGPTKHSSCNPQRDSLCPHLGPTWGLLLAGGIRWVLLRVFGPDVPSESGCVSRQVTW